MPVPVLLEPPPPVHFGPTWEQTPGWVEGDPEDTRYILPEVTLGWHVLTWISANLLDDEGDPFAPTPEQARFILWLYAVDDLGRFLYRDIILQRLKGWGKDPLAAVICAVEFVGPARFSHFSTKRDRATGTVVGDPVGKRHRAAWVQVAATSQRQTDNTMTIFAGLFTEVCKAQHGIDLGKEIIYAYGGQVRIQAVTSSPKSLEGARPTFVILNETHHWLEANDGHEMSRVIKRNIRKNKGGQARTLSITNAYEPSQGSVAQVRRETWEDQVSGDAIAVGVMYDSLEADPDALLTLPRIRDDEGKPVEPEDVYELRVRAYIRHVVLGVRGDSWWLDPEEIVAGVLDGETGIGDARRFYYNQVVTAEDAWVDSLAVDRAVDPLAAEARSSDPEKSVRAGWIIRKEEEIVLFFDGSKSRDHTALVACRISDGAIFTMGHWAPPKEARARKRWVVPRGEVHARVVEIFGRFNVVAFFADPSHTKDEMDGDTRFWDGIIDGWHRLYKERLLLWSTKTGNNQHSIMWDMSSPENQKAFVGAAERFVSEIEAVDDIEEFAPEFTIDGHPELVRHLKNAKEYPHPKGYGDSLWKGSRRGNRKIDLAVSAVGARMLRRLYLNRDPEEAVEKPGEILMY